MDHEMLSTAGPARVPCRRFVSYRTRARLISLSAVVACAAMTFAPAPAAAADPLEAAQAKITAARVAADKAATQFDEAQAQFYSLQDEAQRTERNVADLRVEAGRLRLVVQQRAVRMYMTGGGLPLGSVFADTSDAVDVARRAVLVDTVNAEDQTALAQFAATQDDLRARESALRKQLDEATRVLDELRGRQAQLQQDLEDATRAEQDLRAELERQRRASEFAEKLREAQASARARTVHESLSVAGLAATTSPVAPPPPSAGSASGGGPGQVIGGGGGWVCPVQGGASFTDTYGAPRSGGRGHKGVDMFAARGTPVVAVLPGSVFFQGDPLGGNAAYVQASDGNTYYYAHLNDYAGGGRSVAAGEVIGHVGNTGDAIDAPPHLHFEMRIGGPNGERVNPYSITRAHC
jgi:peptidoglycan LD-endopeptidase LytH